LATASIERDISSDDTVLLTTGASGLPQNVLDTRIPNAGKIANGPYPLQGPNPKSLPAPLPTKPFSS